MRHRLLLMLAAVTAWLVVSPAWAQPAAPPSRLLPLGFAKLHWGMTTDEAKMVYPSLRQGAAPTTLSLDGYSYDGCNFAVALNFTAGKLSAIALDGPPAPGMLQCADQIHDALEPGYRSFPSNLYYPNPTRRDHFQQSWYGPDTALEINALAANGALAIRLSATNTQ